jgi:hypothetical protein
MGTWTTSGDKITVKNSTFGNEIGSVNYAVEDAKTKLTFSAAPCL